ncbi:MAG TPA: DUF4410 domain-containing protein [Methylomirabilota bacterium]|nr:DUF4410 domain-containing protein [Methylomirabilota bacterium]
MKGESDLLPKPGTRVELGSVTNISGASFDVDAVGLLRQAMGKSLREEQLAWSAGDNLDHLIVNLEISDYRPGNAFKRWLLPGYGSTVLAVQGKLLDASTGALAASINYQRSVHFGGAYTIGAWESIFQTVADDLAQDLKIKIEKGGNFIIALTPRSEQEPAPPPPESAPKIKVGGFTDMRSDKGRIGERTAAFGVSMGDVYLSRRVHEVMHDALVDDLLAAGYRVVDSGQDITVQGQVSKFWVHTDTTPLYWDMVGEIEIALASDTAQQRSFTCHQVDRTYTWPSAALIGKVLDACISDLMKKVRTDAIWKR